MKQQPLILTTIIGAALAASSLHAQILYFDTDYTTGAVWDTTVTNWDTTPTTTPTLPWSPNDGTVDAVFDTGNGFKIVTVSSAIQADQVTVDNATGGLVIFGGSGSLQVNEFVANRGINLSGPSIVGGFAKSGVNGLTLGAGGGAISGTINITGGSVSVTSNTRTSAATTITVGAGTTFAIQTTGVVIGGLTGTGTVNAFGGGASNTFTLDLASNNTFGGSFLGTASNNYAVVKSGSARFTATNVNAFSSAFINHSVTSGEYQVGVLGSNAAAGDFNTFSVSAGATLSSDATGRGLIGFENGYNATTGNFAGTNTNGFQVTTAGPTATIDPTGVFGITKLDASAGITLKIDSGVDLVSLFSLTGATSAASFSINATDFSSIAVATPYTALRWETGTGVDYADFAALLPGGFSLDSGFGTGGFLIGSDLQGNFLQVQVIPEPSTWALLAGGLTVMIAFRRRRGIA
jgi:hypothetical protein